VVNFAVTPDAARRIYGVVLDPDSNKIDIQATAALRAEIRRERAKNGKKLTEE